MKRLQQQRQALGSDCLLTLVVDDAFNAEPMFISLWQQIGRFEATFSRFQPDSELTYVNEQAGQQTPVSSEFIALVTVAKDLAERTGGLYNPFVLPSLQRAGYKGSWPDPQAGLVQTDFTDRRLVPFSELRVGSTWVQLPTSAAIDFGGIGKGYLLDQLTDWLHAQGVDNYWLSLGGDILCSGNDVTGEPWTIGIQGVDQQHAVGTVQGKGGRLAIATSGVTKRRGPSWHHIIDPRTGRPADTDVLTATIATTAAVEADVFAKCAVIVGSSAAVEWLKSHTIDTYLVQYKKGTDVQILTEGNIT